MKKLIISCMDYRLSEEILKKIDQNTIILRNAGANVYELREVLTTYTGVEEVIYLPHTDCAAIKLVNAVLKEGKKADNVIMEKLVKPFEGTTFSSIQELEKINAELQAKYLKEIFPKSKIITELIDVTKIKIPERKPVYCLLKSETKYNKEMIGAYIIQAPKKELVIADIKIAEQLSLKQAKSEL